MSAGGQRRVTTYDLLQKDEGAIALWMTGRELAARFFDEIGPMPDSVLPESVIGWADYSALGVAAPALRFPLKGARFRQCITVFLDGDPLQKGARALSLPDLDWPATVDHYLLSPDLDRDVQRWREHVQEVVGS